MTETSYLLSFGKSNGVDTLDTNFGERLVSSSKEHMGPTSASNMTNHHYDYQSTIIMMGPITFVSNPVSPESYFTGSVPLV